MILINNIAINNILVQPPIPDYRKIKTLFGRTQVLPADIFRVRIIRVNTAVKKILVL